MILNNEQVPNAFATPTQGSEAPTFHSKQMSVNDGAKISKCLGDIVGKLVSCMSSTR